MSKQGLYIHVPFCKSRCIYCDFYSTTFGQDVQNGYMAALEREAMQRTDYLPSRTFDSVYIGGGTPSVLTPVNMKRLLDVVHREFNLVPGAEVTIELNPNDVTKEMADLLVWCGVNRVSMGVQSFDDRMLTFLRRRHNADQALRAVDTLTERGVTNISIDLIYGLPNQSIADWHNDLERAFDLPISHMSAYSLMFEEGTPLYKMREQRLVSEAPEEMSLEMFEELRQYACKKGFVHYEISNFALPGKQAFHNTGYWTGMHYLGLGPGAHSYNGTSRQYNAPDVRAYISAFASDSTVSCNVAESETLTLVQQQEEMLLTSLRTACGLNLPQFADRFGQEALRRVLKRALPYINRGQLTLLNQYAETFPCGGDTKMQAGEDLNRYLSLVLTTDGIFVSDDIISSLFE